MKAASVVLTTYDDDHRLELSLSGYAAQSVKDFELWVVNDGGPRTGGIDQTRLLVESFRPQLDVHYLYLEPESAEFRLASARNLGIRQAQAKTLIISDGDCVPHPDLVQILTHYARDDRLLLGVRKLIPFDAIATLTSADLPKLPDLVWQDDERLGFLGETVQETFRSLKDSTLPTAWGFCWGCLMAAPLWKFQALVAFAINHATNSSACLANHCRIC
jgi:glycosyltransferase involved in cell wall biosynthesis